VEKLAKEGKPGGFFKTILPRLKEKADKADHFIKKYDLQNNSEIRDAAIRFVLNKPDVHSVCISFNNFDDVASYLKLSGTRLTTTDMAKLDAYREGCGALYCRHACGICEQHCPYGVQVNTIMRFDHYFAAQRKEKYAMLKYAELHRKNATFCQSCEGHCERACPYGVPIQGLLMLAHLRLTLV
jgi:predicted aldo/keto reductase-like oxidoreductase